MTDKIPKSSTSSTKTTTAILPGVAAVPLEWKIPFPWLRGDLDNQLGNGLRFLGLFLIVMAAVVLITGNGYLATVVGFFIILVTGHFFAPATYRLDSEGIERKTVGRRQFKPWSQFASARTDDLMLQLYPKGSVLHGRYRTVLRIPLCRRGSTSCEKLQRLMPLRVEYSAAEQAPPKIH